MLEEPALDIPEMKALMESFNLDEIEIKLYLYALRTQKSSVVYLAQICNCDRTKVYRSIEKLTGLGLIQVMACMPMRIIAIEPTIAFNDILNQKKDSVKLIENSLNSISNILQKVYKNPEEEKENIFSLVQGIYYNYSRINNLIRNAKTRIDIIIPFIELKKQFYTILPEELKKKKIPIRLISNPDTIEQIKFVERIKNCEIRFTNKPISRMIITDEWCIGEIFNERMVYKRSINDKNETTGFITNSKILIETLQTEFNSLWRKNGS